VSRPTDKGRLTPYEVTMLLAHTVAMLIRLAFLPILLGVTIIDSVTVPLMYLTGHRFSAYKVRRELAKAWIAWFYLGE